MRRFISVVVVVGVSLLGAAGAVSVETTLPAGAKSPGFNSCTEVTQSQAAKALGTSVTSGVLGSATVEGGLACVFYGPSATRPRNPNVAQPDSVRVVVVKGSNALKWYDAYKSKVPAKSVAGYGSQAYYDGYASFNVLKASYYVRIAVSPADGLPSLADEEQLAAAILPKL